MDTPFKPGQLLDLEAVANYLGQPLGSVRRWIHKPPEGFPPVLRIGSKIVVRWSQLERWATGTDLENNETLEPPQERHSKREATLGAAKVRVPYVRKPPVSRPSPAIAAESQSDQPKRRKSRLPIRKLEQTAAQIVASINRQDR
jgi:hypothetical protein